VKTIVEPERHTPIVDEADVVVAGGGLSGVAAAVAAGRNKAETILLERNGFLGGVATAGLMASIGNYFFDHKGELVIRGIALEMVERLAKKGGTSSGWKIPSPMVGGTLSKIAFDPEVLKLVLDEMVEEAGVNVLFHTMVTDTILKENQLNGIIIENKSGRQAILAKNIVDTTGDADIAAKAGAPFNYNPPGFDTLNFRLGNVDMQKTYEYFKEYPEEYSPLVGRDNAPDPRGFEENWLKRGIFFFPHYGGKVFRLIQDAIKKGEYTPQKGTCIDLDAFCIDGLAWNKTATIVTGIFQIDNLNALEISKAEMEGRKWCFYAAEFLKKYMPGFENAFIIGTAQDLGVRWSRWIRGEYIFTRKDVEESTRFSDVIGVGTTKQGAYDIPYRVILPQKVDNLLVASGKSASTEPRGLLRGMARGCIILGQAAGTAAALSTKMETTPRKLDVRELQRTLLNQGVYLGDASRLKELGLA